MRRGDRRAAASPPASPRRPLSRDGSARRPRSAAGRSRRCARADPGRRDGGSERAFELRIVHSACPAVADAVLAPRPAAGPALAFLQLFLGPPNAALSGHLLLGVLDPADELVASKGGDVLPGIERRGVRDQRATKVHGQFMHHPTGHRFAGHRPIVVSRPRAIGPRRCGLTIDKVSTCARSVSES